MSFKSYVIGIAILILTMAVIINGINVFYGDSPNYSDFCSDARFPAKVLGNDTVCPTVCVELYEVDEETNRCILNNCGSGCGADGVTSFETLKQCEIILSGQTCYDAYEQAQENYSKDLFFITLALGVFIIVIGTLVFGLESVGAGLMAGGVGIILWGITGFWRFADDWLRFILSLIGLVVLIWLAYYFNSKVSGKPLFKKKRKKK